MSLGQHISTRAIKNAFENAKAKHKLGLATVFTIPGPKMYFQGDEELNLSRFKFFREFSDEDYNRENKEGYVDWVVSKKGYDWYEPLARKDSLIDSVEASNKTYSEQIKRFSSDLSDLVRSSDALTKGEIVSTKKDAINNVHIHQLKHNDEEILVIKNFGSKFHNDYSIEWFPEGRWEEVFNSDSDFYGGMNFVNAHRGSDISWNNQKINLAPNSVSILRKV